MMTHYCDHLLQVVKINASNKLIKAFGSLKVFMLCLEDMLLNVVFLSISSQSGEIRYESQQRGL